MQDIMLLMSAMYKVFFNAVLPLASLACLWFSVLYIFRGVRGILRRGRAWRNGLHASGVLLRHDERGDARYVPVFTYTTAHGDEVDILGKDDFSTADEAMQAHRPLVYADERPDAAVARSAIVFLFRPLGYMLVALLLAVLAHVLLVCMPD